MLAFNPHDPFPLIEPDYPAEKQHSAAVDEWLGLPVKRVEGSLTKADDGQQRWIGFHPSVFLTPYTELRRFLAEIAPAPGETVVDLGAGYGRLGFVLARHYPEVHYHGLELVPERVKEGVAALTRFGATHARLDCADLAAASPPPAKFYFIYDYGARAAISKTLADLRAIAAARGIVVVGRGRSVRDLVEREHPWLGAVVDPVHRAHYSIYRSHP